MKTLRFTAELIALLSLISVIAILALSLDASKTPDFSVYVSESGSSESRFSAGYKLLDSLTLWISSYSTESAVTTTAWIAYLVVVLGSWLVSSRSTFATLLVASNSGIYGFIHIRATIGIGLMLIALWLALYVKEKKTGLQQISWLIYGLGALFHPLIIVMSPFYALLTTKNWPKSALSTKKLAKERGLSAGYGIVPSIGIILVVAAGGWASREAALSVIPLIGTLVPVESIRDAAINYSAYVSAGIDTSQTNAYVAVGLARCIILATYCSIARRLQWYSLKDGHHSETRSQKRHDYLSRIGWVPPVVAFLITCFAGQEGFTRLVSMFNPLMDIGIGLGMMIALRDKRYFFAVLVGLSVVMTYTIGRMAMVASYLA